MSKNPAADVGRVATHPVSTVAYVFGLLRGTAASLIRVAAGREGSLVPGDLPGPTHELLDELAHDEDAPPPAAPGS